MSECVVRMEIPSKDRMCQMADDIDGVWYCLVMKKLCRQPDNWEMPSWCPIICELPQGHGRLIDADAMAEDLNYDVELDAKALADMNIVGYARERFQFDKDRKQDCIRYLSGQKTIVPAEAESPSPKPTDPVPIRDVYYVMTECDAKTGTVKYEPRERIEL